MIVTERESDRRKASDQKNKMKRSGKSGREWVLLFIPVESLEKDLSGGEKR